jgi:CheY-like chemotaxis protein
MTRDVTTAAPWRPVVYIAVDDPACRDRITETLRRLGWNPIEQPSGFHVLRAIADAVDRDDSIPPGLIVVDEVSRGCSGRTLAEGLRELGCGVPIVLVRAPRPGPRPRYRHGVYVVDHAHAPDAITALVRPWSPIAFTQPAPLRIRAMA